MLILSWNCAGWGTTIKRIDADYPASSSSSSSAAAAACSAASSSASSNKQSKQRISRSQCLANYLARHSADIFCVQEAKIPLSQLSSRSEPLGCSSIPGYESFWCPNNSPDASKRGFNGVCTYAKVGLVQSADCRPLGSDEFDDQGRCIMTDHGSFVLFNVYVPAGGGNPLSYKMKFLNAFRRAMKRKREEGKHVILTGDLNIAHKRDDVHWKYRVVVIDTVLDEVRRADGSTASLPKWKLELAENWTLIDAALATKEVVPVTTKNTKTGVTFDKHRVRVAVGDSKRLVFLGKAESSEEEASYYYDFRGCTYFDEDEQEERVARKANCICLEILMELMSKIVGIEWDDEIRKEIAATSADVKHASPTIQWLDRIVNDDDMVDTFRHFYPNARDRFTCWHQYTNKRFENEGCRIDYMLVDRPLLEQIEKGADEAGITDVCLLRCANFEGDPMSEEAAFHAATASGMFKGSSFEGGGIAAASQTALDTQFGTSHTGIVYTPPSYSDHIATSLVFKDSFVDTSLELDESDAATKKAQPHKKQKSIASFFGKQPAGTVAKQSNGGMTSSSGGATSKKPADGLENALQRQASSSSAMSISSGSDGKRKGQQSLATSFKRTKSAESSNSTISKNKTKKKEETKPKKGSIMSHFAKKG